MTHVTVIGSGNTDRAIAGVVGEGGNTVELLAESGRRPTRTQRVRRVRATAGGAAAAPLAAAAPVSLRHTRAER